MKTFHNAIAITTIEPIANAKQGDLFRFEYYGGIVHLVGISNTIRRDVCSWYNWTTESDASIFPFPLIGEETIMTGPYRAMYRGDCVMYTSVFTSVKEYTKPHEVT
jgi:hypothetical protein